MCKCNTAREVYLKFYKLREDAIIPNYKHVGDSGFDLYIPENENTIILKPLERRVIKTGLIAVFGPEYELQVRSKSGRALKNGLIVLNTPGTVEHNYTGELGVIVINLSNEVLELKAGEAIAQGVLCPVVNLVNSDVTITETCVDPNSLIKVESDNTRGTGGFGSTGLNR